MGKVREGERTRGEGDRRDISYLLRLQLLFYFLPHWENLGSTLHGRCYYLDCLLLLVGRRSPEWNRNWNVLKWKESYVGDKRESCLEAPRELESKGFLKLSDEQLEKERIEVSGFR